MNILDKYIKRSRRTASRIWGRTAVILLLPYDTTNAKDNILELSPDGTYIWRLLEKKPKIREIVESFAKKKRISRDIATKEVIKFVKNLAAEELAEILDKKEEG